MPADTTTKQMALTRDTGPGGFMERVTATLAYACNSILTEPGTTPYHQQRAFYAQKVVQMPSQAASMAGPQVVMGVNVVNSTVYDEGTKTSICTIADIDLQSQVLTLWNALAGIDTPS